MRLEFTAHARTAMEERRIEIAWVERALATPARTETPGDGTTHSLVMIPERNGRILRVITRTDSSPPIVITMFFDRREQRRRE